MHFHLFFGGRACTGRVALQINPSNSGCSFSVCHSTCLQAAAEDSLNYGSESLLLTAYASCIVTNLQCSVCIGTASSAQSARHFSIFQGQE